MNLFKFKIKKKMKKLNLNIFKVQLKKNCRKIDLLRIILYQIRMKKF